MLTCGNEDIPLDFGPKNFVEKEKGEEGGGKKRIWRIEKLHLLSSFSGDRMVGFRRSKRESSSSQ